MAVKARDEENPKITDGGQVTNVNNLHESSSSSSRRHHLKLIAINSDIDTHKSID